MTMWNSLAGLSTVNIKLKKLFPGAILPSYGSAEAAGADLYSMDFVSIQPGNRAMISTGIAIELPIGFEAQVRPRSGLATKSGITIANSPGTVDSDYRGEVKVCLINHSFEPFMVREGDRVAQLVIVPIFRARFELVDQLASSQRGVAGFGSTGR